METKRENENSNLKWGIGASVLLHLAIIAGFLLYLVPKQTEPSKEQTVKVALVKPEDAPKPKAKKEEMPKPPKPKQKQEPPKLPAPKPSPKPEAAKAQTSVKLPPLQVMRPVFQFGEKDGGSRKSLNGDSAREAGKDNPEMTKKQEQAKMDQPAKNSGKPVPQGVNLPKTDTPATVGASGGVALPAPAEKKKDETANKQTQASGPPLKEAKKLYSPKDLQSAAATTAMANMPRKIRGSQLCMTELREQLRHSSPAWNPEMLPAYALSDGTVTLQVDRAAFKTKGRWYNLSFRCEVDDAVKKVTSFALQVGDPVPRSEWKARGFPQ